MTAAKVMGPEHYRLDNRWFDARPPRSAAPAQPSVSPIQVNIPLPQPLFTEGHPYILGKGVNSTSLHVVDTKTRPVEDVGAGVWLWFALCGKLVAAANEEPLAWPWCPDCRRRAGLPSMVLPAVEQTKVIEPIRSDRTSTTGQRSAPLW